MVDQLASQLRSRGMSARVAAMAMLVTDELLSNAVHNAPIGADGVRYRADLPRDAAIDLDRRHQVRLRWGCDGRYLAIEVADRFGSLERDTVLQALTHNGAKDTGGGAGMGIALAYRSCDHLVFNLAPGMRTEVIALIDIRFPPGERVPASSYNVFVERNMTVETRGRTTMEAQGDVLVIRGAIDEAAGLPELLGRARNNQLVLDLGGVTFINSLGVRDWIRMQVAAQRTGIAIELRRLAEPIVHQMNMILATRGAKVVSFYAPYACNECGREESVLLDVAAHAPALARREAPAIACSECHTGMEFNDFPERYFSFIPV
jgi:anti-anti-sigma regulatory factor